MRKYSIVFVSTLLLISCTPQAQTPSSTPDTSSPVSQSESTPAISSPVSPEAVTQTPSSTLDTSSPVSQERVTQAQSGAKLTSNQMSQINSLGNIIILPTYIPAGFEVAYLDIEETGSSLQRYYSILYHNPSTSACFIIQGGTWGLGGGLSDSHNVKVMTKALGEVYLNTFSLDYASKPATIELDYLDAAIEKDGEPIFFLSFSSPGQRSGGTNGIICQPLKLEEAVKVVQSLERIS